MEKSDANDEFQPPPVYNNQGYEQVKKEMDSSSNNVQSTMVTIMSEGPPVRDHIIWSLVNAMYLNCCCLGVLALVYSVKSRDKNLLGDRSGATSYASTARTLNIYATITSVVFIIITLALVVVQMGKMSEMMQESMRQKNMTMNIF